MDRSDSFISLNGKIIRESEAEIPATISGLYYGAGCFETFLSESGAIFKFENHLIRLHEGLQYLGVTKEKLPQKSNLLSQIKNLFEKNELSDTKSKIRIQASLLEKSGYSLKNNNQDFLTMITASPFKEKSRPKTLILSETSVVPSQSRPTHLKLSNMLHYRNAFREAEMKGADDSILVNNKAFVAETSIANIFWMKDDEIFTPSEDCDILPGVMRNSLIDILNHTRETKVKEGRFSFDELMAADVVWLTNSTWDFVPVSDIEGAQFKTDLHFFSELRENLDSYKKQNMIHV